MVGMKFQKSRISAIVLMIGLFIGMGGCSNKVTKVVYVTVSDSTVVDCKDHCGKDHCGKDHDKKGKKK